ncbi:4-hydroxy-3-methylbut-2-enyl diphosphate reductase [bacterium]|nr:4-hydroxy-3-methylbut-2-enyl diphosphate reductase [bacterium]
MKVTIDPKCKPCPGVDNILHLAEDVLARNEIVYTVGDLIHNKREIDRLVDMGLEKVSAEFICNYKDDPSKADPYFLIRAHGEAPELIEAARKAKMIILDGTCPIVKHSQDIIDQHARDGWRILIAGKHQHAEVVGLMGYTHGNGAVVSNIKEASSVELESRSLLLAQTTIDPLFYSKIRKKITSRITGLKVIDSTCRFIGNRCKDVENFAQLNDAVIMLGGTNSSNCRLLFKTLRAVNNNSQHIESGASLDYNLLNDAESVGITGGASTPTWQIEELKNFLESTPVPEEDNSPEGLKNTKGGNILWRIWKNQSKTA